MLSLVGEDVINNVEELDDADGEAVFFKDLARNGASESLAEGNASPGKLPFVTFITSLWTAFGEKEQPFGIHDDCTNADADIVDALLHGR